MSKDISNDPEWQKIKLLCINDIITSGDMSPESEKLLQNYYDRLTKCNNIYPKQFLNSQIMMTAENNVIRPIK